MSSTTKSNKNVKGDRKVVRAEYYAPESIFEIPDGLDLTDKTIVEKWYVCRNILHIKYVGKEEEEEIEPTWDAHIQGLEPYPEICQIEDADDVGFDYECDEEEEEDMKTIDWVSKNAKFIDFSAEAMARSNEPDTEPESDTEDEEEEVDKYKLWKSQSIEITCRKCGDIGHKHDWNDCDDDMKYGTCGACEEEEEERKPCEDCGYYELMENDEIYGNICECYADSTDVCGQTGRYFDSRNPLNGCGKKIREDDGDENIMIGNISFCIECAESSEGEKAMKYYEEEYEEEEEEEEKVDKKKPVLRIVE